MTPEDASNRSRRGQWPVRVTRLSDASQDDLSAYTTATQRILMVGELTAEAWSVAGRATPAYARSETLIALRPLRPTGAVRG
jgi:hypothetical protein